MVSRKHLLGDDADVLSITITSASAPTDHVHAYDDDHDDVYVYVAARSMSARAALGSGRHASQRTRIVRSSYAPTPFATPVERTTTVRIARAIPGIVLFVAANEESTELSLRGPCGRKEDV
jgi:hypothetical protein